MSQSPPISPSPSPKSQPQPPKKTQAIPWSHDETLNLIQAYQEKWYSLKRGQLKASRWEQVATTVASLCGFHQPSKSSTQCRHKIEKLRKRYRAEKIKPFTTTSWVYYPFMESLEHGPLPISIAPPALSDNDDEGEGGDELGCGSVRKFDGFVNNQEFENGYQTDLKKMKYFDEGEDDDDDDDDLMGELATQMRDFAERFVKVEKKKLEMMREAERFRIEMENKRMEMILVSQQKTVEMISKVFGS